MQQSNQLKKRQQCALSVVINGKHFYARTSIWGFLWSFATTTTIEPLGQYIQLINAGNA